jgi:hypothetical protein
MTSTPAKKMDDKTPTSPEFVKWAKEALRGLNGVNGAYLEVNFRPISLFDLEPRCLCSGRIYHDAAGFSDRPRCLYD